MYVSSVPALLDCASSQAECEHPYEPKSDAADAGSGAHDALAEVAMGREPDLDGIAKSYGVEPKELSFLTHAGRLAWEEVKQYFPVPMVEHRLRGDWLRGRADVFSVTDEDMAILDWKSNRERTDYNGQLMGYAACAADQYGMPESGKIRVFTVWLRLGEIDCRAVRQDDIERFYHEVSRARLNIGKSFNPGQACTYCRRQLVCEARTEYVRSSMMALQVIGDEFPNLPEAKLGRLYSRVQMVEKVIRQYRDGLRMQLRADGPQYDGNGKVIDLVERKRDIIKPMEAWTILQDNGFSDEELARCISISSTQVGDVAAERAPKGGMGKARAAIKQALRDGGALTTDTYEVITATKGTIQ